MPTDPPIQYRIEAIDDWLARYFAAGSKCRLTGDALFSLRRRVFLERREAARQARLDEHRILAGLDEEGKQQRYLELAQEGAR